MMRVWPPWLPRLSCGAPTVTSDTAALTADWTRWAIPMSDFAGVNFAKVQNVIIGVGAKGAATAGGKGMVCIDDIGYGRSAK